MFSFLKIPQIAYGRIVSHRFVNTRLAINVIAMNITIGGDKETESDTVDYLGWVGWISHVVKTVELCIDEFPVSGS